MFQPILHSKCFHWYCGPTPSFDYLDFSDQHWRIVLCVSRALAVTNVVDRDLSLGGRGAFEEDWIKLWSVKQNCLPQ